MKKSSISLLLSLFFYQIIIVFILFSFGQFYTVNASMPDVYYITPDSARSLTSPTVTIKGSDFQPVPEVVFGMRGLSLAGTSDTPNAAKNSYVRGDYAYVADGDSGLQVVYIIDPQNPVILGACDTPNYSHGIFVEGNYAYIADWDSGLQVIDISNPQGPLCVSSISTPDSAKDVSVKGNFVYIAAGGSGLQVIDMSDTNNLGIIGSCNTPDDSHAIFVSGFYAYIADWDSGLQVIDIRDANSPLIVGSCQTSGPASGVYVSDNYAYVASGGSGLEIIDISEPHNPVIVGSCDTLDFASSVYVLNGFAYVADLGAGLQVIDISDPQNPYIIDSYDTPDASHGVFVSDFYVFLSSEDTGLIIINTLESYITLADVAYKDSGTITACVPSDSPCGIHDLYIINPDGARGIIPNAFTIYRDFCQDLDDDGFGNPNMCVRDCTPPQGYREDNTDCNDNDPVVYPGAPELCDSKDNDCDGNLPANEIYDRDCDGVPTPNDCDDTDPNIYPGAREVICDGIDQDCDGMDLSDISIRDIIPKAADTKIATDVQITGACFWQGIQADLAMEALTGTGIYTTPGTAKNSYVIDRYAYVADGGSGLQVIDISNPEHPVIIGAFDTPGYSHGVFVVDNFAYIADWGGGLQIIDISDPRTPVIAGSYSTKDYAKDVSITGNYAYIAYGASGLHIVDISSPQNPILVGSCDTLGDSHGIYVKDNYAYVADSEYGLQITDIMDPQNPVIVGNCDTDGIASDVSVYNHYAYVAAGTSGLKIIDISDPGNPVIISTFPAQDASSVHIFNQRAYITDTLSGILVIDINDTQNPFMLDSMDIPGASHGIFVSDFYIYVSNEYSGVNIVNTLKQSTGLINITFFDSNNITATVPENTPYGKYYVYVKNPDGNYSVLEDTFTIYTLFCTDTDSDGYGDPDNICIQGYTPLSGYVNDNTDCDDNNPAIHPGAQELCDGNDNDCDGVYFPGEASDKDNDGILACSDCDDTDPRIYPGADEIQCDGIDQDCDGADLINVVVKDITPDNGSSATPINVTIEGSCFQPIPEVNFIDTNISEAGSCDTSGLTKNSFVKGNYAYVADGDSGVQVIDISDPCAPVIIESCYTPNESHGIYIAGSYAYVADWDSGLQILDITDPQNIAIIGSVNTPGSAKDVVVKANYAYVADGRRGLQVIDISDKEEAVIIGRYDTPGDSHGIEVSGGYAFIADWNGGLQIVDISDPQNPKYVSHKSTTGAASGVIIREGYAYVAARDSGLRVIDISDLQNPLIIGICDTPGTANNVRIMFPYAYIADGNSGLQVINISSPQNPYIVAAYDTLAPPHGIYISGRYAFLADESSGLIIVNLLNPLTSLSNIRYINPDTITAAIPQNTPAGTYILEVKNPDKSMGVLLSAFTVYIRACKDADGDGYGDPDLCLEDTNFPSDYVGNNTDCDDNNAAVYPGAQELCDGKDNDCNGVLPVNEAQDRDDDGALACNDCNDTDPNIHPGAQEICNDRDENCNGIPDDGLPLQIYYYDKDGDTFGDPFTSLVMCKQPYGYVMNNTDCDDNDVMIYQGNPEKCDGKDNDCDGFIQLEEFIDADGDGLVICADCDDNVSFITPGVTEFFGSARIDTNNPLQIGDEIRAYIDSHLLCAGLFIVNTTGSYGPMHVYVDDPNTYEKDGVEEGDSIVFQVCHNNTKFTFKEGYLWTGDKIGYSIELNLTVYTEEPPNGADESKNNSPDWHYGIFGNYIYPFGGVGFPNMVNVFMPGGFQLPYSTYNRSNLTNIFGSLSPFSYSGRYGAGTGYGYGGYQFPYSFSVGWVGNLTNLYSRLSPFSYSGVYDGGTGYSYGGYQFPSVYQRGVASGLTSLHTGWIPIGGSGAYVGIQPFGFQGLSIW